MNKENITLYIFSFIVLSLIVAIIFVFILSGSDYCEFYQYTAAKDIPAKCIGYFTK